MSTTAAVDPARATAPAAPMGLEEARQILWLSSRPKPLGELLDEGYLDTSRLEWAAENAYNPRLKEAARVLLGWRSSGTKPGIGSGKPQAAPAKTKKPFRVGIGLEEARSILWPFGPLRGQPMGVLSETRRLSLKDLAYAVENAWDQRVQQAAVVLMLTRLDQALEEPPPPAGMMRVVAGGRSYAERQQLSLAFLEGAIAGAGLALCLAYLVTSLLQDRTSARPRMTLAEVLASPEWTLALAIALVVVAGVVLLGHFVLRQIFKRLDQQIEAYRRGEEGEERVVEEAVRALDGKWILFRNLVLPGRRRADLDIVLVGPPGVWTLEVKALAGKYKNVGDAWGYRAGNRWKRMSKNPSQQARKGAIALAEFLRADGIKTYVSAAVAWANAEGRVSVEDPFVPVWTIDRLQDELGNLWNGQRLEAAAQEKIVEKLTRLCRPRNNGPW